MKRRLRDYICIYISSSKHLPPEQVPLHVLDSFLVRRYTSAYVLRCIGSRIGIGSVQPKGDTNARGRKICEYVGHHEV